MLLISFTLFFGVNQNRVKAQTSVADTTVLKNLLLITNNIQASQNLFFTSSQKLRQQEGLYLKEGSGMMLSSIRFAGGSASQVNVVWEGLKINNINNGQIDATLLPGLIQDMQFSANGGISQNSGNLFGTLKLGQNKQESFIQVNAGSFGNKIIAGAANVERKRYQGQYAAQFQTAKNNFSFNNYTLINNQKERIENAEGSIANVLTKHEWQLKKQNSFYLATWFTMAERNIPNIILNTNTGNSKQKDEGLRISLKYAKNFKNKEFRLTNGINIEKLRFTENNNSSFFKTLLLQNTAEIILKSKNIDRLSLGVSNENGSVIGASNKLNGKSINQIIGYAKFTKTFKQTQIALTANQTIHSLGYMPTTASIDYKWVKNTIMIYGQLSNNFRAPTLNDLFWPSGGNINLLPENGFAQNLHVNYQKQYKAIGFMIDLAGDFYQYQNQIVWLPNGNIWQPKNIRNTQHANFIVKVKIDYSKYKFKHSFGGNYTLTKAVASSIFSASPQLFYTPYSHANINYQICYHKYLLDIGYQYQNISFADIENTIIIPAFGFLNATIAYDIKLKRRMITSLFCAVNNIFDKYYEITKWRPMPGRNFQIGIKTKFNK